MSEAEFIEWINSVKFKESAVINIDKLANSVARKEGCGTATEIKFSPDAICGKVVKHIHYGYRKYTTGEYVPKKYLANFGWKNTYYQHAETVVALPLWVGWLIGEDL